jgi:hypothetical protein
MIDHLVLGSPPAIVASPPLHHHLHRLLRHLASPVHFSRRSNLILSKQSGHIPIPTTSTLIDSELSDIHASHVILADITRKSNRMIHFRPDLNAPDLSKFMQLGQINKRIDYSHPFIPSAVHRELAEYTSRLSLKFHVVIS